MILRLSIEAYAATEETATVLERLKSDRLLARSRILVGRGGLDEAIRHYRDHSSPQLVIVEETGERAVLLERLGRLAEVVLAGTRVVVIGRMNDIALYRELLAQGVSDYLIAPAGEQALSASIAALFSDSKAARRARLVSFLGARGGTGSSVLAHNVGWMMAEGPGRDDVLLLDLDFAAGSLGLDFSVEPRQTLSDLLADPERIDAQLIERLVVKYGDHLQLLPAAADLKALPALEIDVVDRVIDIVRQLASHVVLDLPRLWTPWMLHALDQSDLAVIVAEPNLASLRETKGLLDLMARKGGGREAVYVLNKMDGHRHAELTPKDFTETLKKAPAAVLAFDPAFAEASRNGHVLAERARSAKVMPGLAELARLASGREKAQAVRRPLAGLIGLSFASFLPGKG